jgi:protein-S-isoprenylcysteine O-methyltransferase Ste14
MAPFIRTLLFTVIAPGFWTALLPYWSLPRGARPGLSGPGAPGLLLLAAGAVLYLACAFWAFALRGSGTPAPFDPPKKLVVVGPYRVVRNPMYWSVFSVMAGEALLFRSARIVLWAAAFLLSAVLFVVVYEEPALRRKFGSEYEDYCRRVGAWFPRFGKR